ncbi:MAG: hypothetical protein V7K69_07155 [Nostoc sp.]|uniref:hypothetical protein n=1 Tax=Nostoc sp. TaxID=1180 RepID=UPI002FF7938C
MQSLSDLTEKMLIGVAFKYGKDSRQYEIAGVVRKSRATRLRATSKELASENAKTGYLNGLDKAIAE